jgi:hypothetical protein
METNDIFEILWTGFTVASEKAAAADRKCTVTIREISTGLPHPDAIQRVRNVVRELNSARLEMFEADARLTAFVAKGIIPDNLRKDAGQQQNAHRKGSD